MWLVRLLRHPAAELLVGLSLRGAERWWRGERHGGEHQGQRCASHHAANPTSGRAWRAANPAGRFGTAAADRGGALEFSLSEQGMAAVNDRVPAEEPLEPDLRPEPREVVDRRRMSECGCCGSSLQMWRGC